MMERVAFLLESTGERLGCLLNPESLVVRRTAGLRTRRSIGGVLTQTGAADDPLLFTGGGTTELLLDLLFDVSIAGSTVKTEDVRDLTRPLWELAENSAVVDGQARPPLVRFVWGKAWNLPGVVAAVAERLEHFTAGGAPRRSWLRMRLLRVAEPPAPPVAPTPLAPEIAPPETAPAEPTGTETEALAVHEVAGDGVTALQQLYELAERYLGSASLWRLIATFNDITDPNDIPPGAVVRIPPRSVA